VFKLIDRIPLLPLTVAAIFMMLAPFAPEPHLLEKIRMLSHDELTQPIDIFDLFWHSLFVIILLIRLVRLKKPENAE